MKTNDLYQAFILAICLALSVPAQAAELPDDSIYHIGSDWVNQNDQPVNIGSLAGKVQVLAFVYTYCEHSCPIVLGKLKAIERGLSQEQKRDVTFQLITLDPKKDTPAAMRQYMETKNLHPESWNMLNGQADDVLELAALVGVRYRPMSNGKDIAHSNMITVLDRQGRIHYQMKGLDADLQQVVEQIGQAAQMRP